MELLHQILQEYITGVNQENSLAAYSQLVAADPFQVINMHLQEISAQPLSPICTVSLIFLSRLLATYPGDFTAVKENAQIHHILMAIFQRTDYTPSQREYLCEVIARFSKIYTDDEWPFSQWLFSQFQSTDQNIILSSLQLLSSSLNSDRITDSDIWHDVIGQALVEPTMVFAVAAFRALMSLAHPFADLVQGFAMVLSAMTDQSMVMESFDECLMQLRYDRPVFSGAYESYANILQAIIMNGQFDWACREAAIDVFGAMVAHGLTELAGVLPQIIDFLNQLLLVDECNGAANNAMRNVFRELSTSMLAIEIGCSYIENIDTSSPYTMRASIQRLDIVMPIVIKYFPIELFDRYLMPLCTASASSGIPEIITYAAHMFARCCSLIYLIPPLDPNTPPLNPDEVFAFFTIIMNANPPEDAIQYALRGVESFIRLSQYQFDQMFEFLIQTFTEFPVDLISNVFNILSYAIDKYTQPIFEIVNHVLQSRPSEDAYFSACYTGSRLLTLIPEYTPILLIIIQQYSMNEDLCSASHQYLAYSIESLLHQNVPDDFVPNVIQSIASLLNQELKYRVVSINTHQKDLEDEYIRIRIEHNEIRIFDNEQIKDIMTMLDLLRSIAGLPIAQDIHFLQMQITRWLDDDIPFVIYNMAAKLFHASLPVIDDQCFIVNCAHNIMAENDFNHILIIVDVIQKLQMPEFADPVWNYWVEMAEDWLQECQESTEFRIQTVNCEFNPTIDINLQKLTTLLAAILQMYSQTAGPAMLQVISTLFPLRLDDETLEITIQFIPIWGCVLTNDASLADPAPILSSLFALFQKYKTFGFVNMFTQIASRHNLPPEVILGFAQSIVANGLEPAATSIVIHLFLLIFAMLFGKADLTSFAALIMNLLSSDLNMINQFQIAHSEEFGFFAANNDFSQYPAEIMHRFNEFLTIRNQSSS